MAVLPGLHYGVSEKQDQFCRLSGKFRGFVAGRGSGKTEIGAIQVCDLAKAGEPWLVVSPDNNVIELTTWPTFQRVARRLGVWVKGVRSPTHVATIKTFDGGEAQVWFKGAEVPDKLRGGSFAGIWFDECSVIRREAYLLAIGALRWKGVGGPVLMTFTPKGRKHWTFEIFYKEAEQREVDWYYSLVKDYGQDGAELRTGLVKICEALYRPRQNRQLIYAATWDNPFRPLDFVETLSSSYTSQFAEQEVGGRFVDLQGTMFVREWFKLDVTHAPREALRIRYWDLADSDNAGCYTVGTLMAADDSGHVYIEDVQRKQVSALKRDELILETGWADKERYNNEVIVVLEQEPGSGGKYQAQDMVRKLSLRDIPAHRDVPRGARYKQHDGEKIPGLAKIVRARPLSAAAEAELVHVLPGPWRNEFLSELAAFPFSSAMDQVDSAASCFNEIRRRGTRWKGTIDVSAPVGSTKIKKAIGIDTRAVNVRRGY
jgi:phage terminase large subunit-like protein